MWIDDTMKNIKSIAVNTKALKGITAMQDALKPTFTELDNIKSIIGTSFASVNNNEVILSPSYAVTHSLHSVNSVNIYIKFYGTRLWLCAFLMLILLSLLLTLVFLSFL